MTTTMDARLKQFLLIALQSSQDGEALNAIKMARRQLSTIGSDAQSLLNGLSTKSPDPSSHKLLLEQKNLELMLVSQQRDRALQENNRLRQENLALRQSISPASRLGGHADRWVMEWGKSPQQLAEDLLLKVTKLTAKEADFLETVSQWKGWPTDKQLAWLEALWRKHI